jgi:hypothetical protein
VVPTILAARQVNPNDPTHLALVGIGFCGPFAAILASF